MTFARLVDWLVDRLALLPTVGVVAFVLSSLCAWGMTKVVPMPLEPELYTSAVDILTLGFWIFWMWLGWGLSLGRGRRNVRRWLALFGAMICGGFIIMLIPHDGRLVWVELAVVAVFIMAIEDIHKKGDPPIVRDKRLSA